MSEVGLIKFSKQVFGLKWFWDFPGGPVVENSPFNAEDMGLIPDWGTTIPHAPRQLSLRTTLLSPYATGESHEQRSLVGYSPWGRKESDTTQRLHFDFHFLSESPCDIKNDPT